MAPARRLRLVPPAAGPRGADHHRVRGHIDTVSGATVTSDGYRESLQAAIDAAHL
ncbi:FMN-binding protein [Micromonospora carbonacea]|uniref:FMN-binding protein n=1 Tax=Micromonospora carbonacea TaxID=47853 RepID=UPI003722C4A3